jgi:hypothetical protein
MFEDNDVKFEDLMTSYVKVMTSVDRCVKQEDPTAARDQAAVREPRTAGLQTRLSIFPR